MQTASKPFAFKLAAKRKSGDKKWKIREGVAMAGCTPAGGGDFRAWPAGGTPDSDYWC